MDGPVTIGWVAEQQAALAAGVAVLDPDAVLATEAPAMWQSFDRIERLAASAKTLLARRVDDSGIWKRNGHRSPADYLAGKAGTTTARARGDLETSKRLPHQPTLSESCRHGDLSPAQAEAVSGAAAADPDAEGRLVDTAKGSTLADLREECARTRAAADPDPDATHRRIHQQRGLRRFTGPDGTWHLTAQGTAEAAARINAALDPIIEEIFGAARREGRRETYEAYAFDALVELADRSRNRTTPTSGGKGDPVSAGPSRATNPTHLALVRVDLEALVRGAVEDDERCEITGVGPIPVSVARQLLGDSILKLVITRGVDVRNVTHLGRGPTAAQRVALLWTSPHCSAEGCHRTHVQIDHRIPWAETRHTRLDELDHLCSHCHDLKTIHGWALVAGTGRRPLVPPDHPHHPDNAGYRDQPTRAGPDPPPTEPPFPEAC